VFETTVTGLSSPNGGDQRRLGRSKQRRGALRTVEFVGDLGERACPHNVEVPQFVSHVEGFELASSEWPSQGEAKV